MHVNTRQGSKIENKFFSVLDCRTLQILLNPTKELYSKLDSKPTTNHFHQ